jgi:hypothetical protein
MGPFRLPDVFARDLYRPLPPGQKAWQNTVPAEECSGMQTSVLCQMLCHPVRAGLISSVPLQTELRSGVKMRHLGRGWCSFGK